MKKLDKAFRTVATYLDYVSCVCLFLMMAFVVIYVILRAFGYTLFGTYEIVQLSSLLIVTLSLMNNEYDSGNITIDFLDNFLGRLGKKIIMIFSLFVSAGISTICTYRMWTFFMQKVADASVTANLAIPVWVFLIVMFISMALLTICLVYKLVAQIVGYNLGSDKADVAVEDPTDAS